MPKKNIQTQASEVTGLKVINGYLYHNNKKLDSDSVSSAMEKFIQFLQKSESNILIGHNIRTFDCHVLFNALRNCEKMQTFLQHVIGFLDTKTLFKATHPEHKKYTQKALFESIVGEEYAAHDALADVNALTSLVETASISDDIKMKLISTTKHVQDCFNYSIEAQHNMPSLKVLVTSKIVSKNMARTIAGSGLQLKHLCYAYRRNGRSGIESVLQEKQSGSSKVRVTRSRKITDSIADYFAHQDGAMKN